MQANANEQAGEDEGGNERWMNYGETVGNSIMIHGSIRGASMRKKVAAPCLKGL